jgi:hypothetical protein
VIARSGERRSRRPASTTPAVFLVGVARVALWLLLGFLLVRGAGDVLASGERTARSGDAPVLAQSPWPDDGARAFAVDFARAYLSYSPRHPGRYARELAQFVSGELAGPVVPRFAQRGARQVVQTATVAEATRLDESHALVTVAASLATDGVSTRYLTVPVARDAGGGLAVYDLPSFSAPPARAQPVADEAEALPAGEESAIGDVLQRFFAAFLAGRAGELEYFVPAGVRLGALGQRYELAGVESLAQVGAGSARGRTVLAVVRARDARTRAVYALRYRVALVRRDRWYVAAINSREG